jgi:RHH-type proline utilization regulon transcriptional repressor/proline dehydrogenase/delta 1-pyrroline-5-carboxylate dehydrogenase
MSFFSRKPKPSQAPVVVKDASAAVASTLANSNVSPAMLSKEARIFELGSEFLRIARSHKTSLLSSKFYSDALMEWSMKDHAFKVQMFRFVDAYPMLKTPDAVLDHLNDYLSQPGVTVPTPIATAMKASGIAKGLAAKTIGGQITGMAEKFIAGTDAASALSGLKSMWDDGIAFSVDLLGETCVSDEEADYYAKKYLDLIENLPRAVAAWPSNTRLESDHLGAIPRVNVSIKISALSARCDAIDTEGSINDLMRRLTPILESARDRGVFVNFDMEHHALKDFTIELFQRCVEKIDFQAGLAMQAYLQSGPDDARRICEWAKRKNKLVTVRLVKGAYWDAETIKSEMHGWPCPVWPQKWMTDRCFEEMVEIFLDHCPMPSTQQGKGELSTGGPKPSGVKLALGSHNVRSIAAALAGLERRNLPKNAIELQMLHGMADQLKYAAAEMGLRMREYVPVGEMVPGMAYLVRRLLENTSNESWLKAGFMDNADAGALLRIPSPKPTDPVVQDPRTQAGDHRAKLQESLALRHKLSPAPTGLSVETPFFTEPVRDFSDKAQRDAFAAAIARATVPKVANDRTPDQAKAMVTTADAVFEAWRDTDHHARAEALLRAAAIMRRDRDGLCGVLIRESGKTWREADADVCEAIDFCEFYARCAVPLFDRQRLGRFIGELDEQWHQPRGVSVIISPWNFPLAICCGMAVAALVTGNPVIIKPAEQTPGIASIMVDILVTAIAETPGLGGDKLASKVVQFCPAPGETTGAALVRDPRVALIAFTGSRDVGLDIVTAAAPGTPFQNPAVRTDTTHIKKVIAELGGKNAVIIDTSADFDEAVVAVRQSAFAFQGQKCSACSRVIVVDEQGPNGPAMTLFTRRFTEAMKALTIGDPLLPGTDVGPVIDAESATKINGFIERAKANGLACVGLPLPEGNPFVAANRARFVAPHAFLNVPATHELATEEIFGPVVAIIHASSFDEALRIANSTRYKLTGGLFSRKPTHLDKAKRSYRVGNLYINRGITGALVGRQPFGGFGMSGIGSKAGGLDYLLQFVEPRACCENTMRRGFAPEL